MVYFNYNSLIGKTNNNNVNITIQQTKNALYQQMNNVLNSISSQIDSPPTHYFPFLHFNNLPEA